ncbi:bifunctional methylenetetrahydrofolate dehydrogenase/cyclohydrolase, mitochondrial-like [Portunus trituberculatus]|uniref:bifunctional methylenetetrahydrofolate dehydrogenase/cyclohydrolase, mitochondrial-like n=1 Tax=Portunus trituberculatus TaxID=210409 RepID=UPI001E1CF678|nr:bifunctional methylenetetrahydrofolate dehydrogenase/cyclohydrolase, mitochondrial-like [Portunus trituberculatus]
MIPPAVGARVAMQGGRGVMGVLHLARGAAACPSPRRHLHLTQHRHRAVLIDGKKVAAEIHKELAQEAQSLVGSRGRTPHLVLVRVGSDPASGSYVRNKTKAADKIGIQSTIHHLPEDTSQSSLLALVHQLNNDDDVDGILVQLPLPDHMEEKVVCNSVTPQKDVDGFHVINVGRFCVDMNSMAPCTPLGVMELIRRYGIETFGKNAVVCGRSKNVGMPIAMLLHGDGVRPDGEMGGLDATTTICHRYTPPEQLRAFVASADILVTAAGLPGLITGDMIKPGCAIIDVGINRIIDPNTGKPKLVGDCHFDSCVEKASYITPVPGGVGPMTVAMLMRNTIVAAKRSIKY